MQAPKAMGEGTPVLRRPIGVWILTLTCFVGAVLYVVRVAPWFMFPPRHAQLPPDVFAWLYSLTVVTLLGASFGTCAGSDHGRKIFLSILTVFTVLILFGVVVEYFAMSRWASEASDAYVVSALRNMATFAGFWVTWLAFNLWYFSRSRVRAFFTQRSASNPWIAARGMAAVALGIPALVFGSIEIAYQMSGPERRPPDILTAQLRVAPGAELGAEEQLQQFSFIREGGQLTPSETVEGQKFSALLKERFPRGTPERTLIATLSEEGFRRPPFPIQECIAPGETPPPEISLLPCSHDADLEKTLEYGWWRFEGWRRGRCTEGVHVHWSSDTPGIVADVRGEYFKTCLFLFEPRHWIW